jgi:hypothetical protein
VVCPADWRVAITAPCGVLLAIEFNALRAADEPIKDAADKMEKQHEDEPDKLIVAF